MFRTQRGTGLAVHHTVALDALSPSALLYGKPYANSIVFWESFSAVAFYKLRGTYQNIRELLPDADGLIDVIREQFDMYLYLTGKDPEQEYGA